jgi:hypothetical protein
MGARDGPTLTIESFIALQGKQVMAVGVFPITSV